MCVRDVLYDRIVAHVHLEFVGTPMGWWHVECHHRTADTKNKLSRFDDGESTTTSATDRVVTFMWSARVSFFRSVYVAL